MYFVINVQAAGALSIKIGKLSSCYWFDSFVEHLSSIDGSNFKILVSLEIKVVLSVDF